MLPPTTMDALDNRLTQKQLFDLNNKLKEWIQANTANGKQITLETLGDKLKKHYTFHEMTAMEKNMLMAKNRDGNAGGKEFSLHLESRKKRFNAEVKQNWDYAKQAYSQWITQLNNDGGNGSGSGNGSGDGSGSGSGSGDGSGGWDPNTDDYDYAGYLYKHMLYTRMRRDKLLGNDIKDNSIPSVINIT